MLIFILNSSWRHFEVCRTMTAAEVATGGNRIFLANIEADEKISGLFKAPYSFWGIYARKRCVFEEKVPFLNLFQT